ncbi:MAG TPA: type II toxin-antitoxin system RelE/ParE family toxin [Tepidisphaeraceae bacterium]|nr:type II toxin-antitoxin system RelE/ParE family toxin [Tepidisphaeraceae bacterium]
MPATHVIFYAERNVSPFLRWLDDQQQKVQDKIFDAVTRLEALGFELRRPEADLLRDGIYELRVKKGHVNYRPLYFFDDETDPKTRKLIRRRAVIAHGCTKKGRVDATDIDLAIRRRTNYLANRRDHTYVPPPAADAEQP